MAEKTYLELNVPLTAEKALRNLAQSYFKKTSLKLTLLKGDGSDRRIYLISDSQHSSQQVIGIYHTHLQENLDFIHISGRMKKIGLPVPDIYRVAEDNKAYLLQYLGSKNLAQSIDDWVWQANTGNIVQSYLTVLPLLVKMQTDLTPVLKHFLEQRVMDRNEFAKDLAYFEKDFVDRFGFSHLFKGSNKRELSQKLLDAVDRIPTTVFVYRDFQARNIMWWQHRPWFIDYQSAYLGTRYYDLASMLFASKSGLDEPSRNLLLHRFHDMADSGLDIDRFRTEFYLFVLIRRLRSLGTYGYLGDEKGKIDFLAKITPGLRELSFLLREKEELSAFKQTREFITQVLDRWPSKVETLNSEPV